MFARMRSQNYRSCVAPVVTTGILGVAINGSPLVVNNVWGIAYDASVATGAVIPVGHTPVLIYNCDKIMVPKTVGGGLNCVVGERFYLSNAAGFLLGYSATVKANPADICIGFVTEAAAATDTLCEIDLKGDSMTDQA